MPSTIDAAVVETDALSARLRWCGLLRDKGHFANGVKTTVVTGTNACAPQFEDDSTTNATANNLHSDDQRAMHTPNRSRFTTEV